MKRIAILFPAITVIATLVLHEPAQAQERNPIPLVEATISDLQNGYRRESFTPEQVISDYLARIAAYDRAGPHLNSFLHVNANAVAEASALDEEQGDAACAQFDGAGDSDDHAKKPLFGVAVILKDNIATADMPTTAGSIALGKSIPKRDAFIAAKLRCAGAVIIGKGSLSEFANFIALGLPTGYDSLLRYQLFQEGGDLSKVGFGFNPFDPRTDPRTTFKDGTPAPFNDGRPALATGGSSSGPGIAVNASFATVGVGTETSGSILSPASANLLVGIKPTLGLVSRTGIIPITADQDTAGPMARTVTDAAKLLGTLAGFDPADAATSECLKPGKCFRDYTQFLDGDALKGARIAVPKRGYQTDTATGLIPLLSPAQQEIISNAIAVLRAKGAIVEDFDIPDQQEFPKFGTCVTLGDLAARTDPTKPVACTTDLLYGFKQGLNAYLNDFGPGVSVSGTTVNTLADVIHFNDTFTIGTTKPGLKYGQAIAIAADSLDTSPGSKDTAQYLSDRQRDIELSRTKGLDLVYQKYDAILFPANFGANIAARAGFPSIVVPGGFIPNAPPTPFPAGFAARPSPFGVTFSGPAFSEPRLIAYAYAFEQATHHRVAPASTPELPGTKGE